MILAMSLLLAVTFNFTLPSSKRTSAGILDSGGRLVKVLWQDEVKPAGVNTEEWDGTDNFGVTLPEGSLHLEGPH